MQGEVNTGWRKRYCTLQAAQPARLYYFASEDKAEVMRKKGTSVAKGFVELSTVVQVYSDK